MRFSLSRLRRSAKPVDSGPQLEITTTVPAKGEASSQAAAEYKGHWQCHHCSLQNSLADRNCNYCGSRKGRSLAPAKQVAVATLLWLVTLAGFRLVPDSFALAAISLPVSGDSNRAVSTEKPLEQTAPENTLPSLPVSAPQAEPVNPYVSKTASLMEPITIQAPRTATTPAKQQPASGLTCGGFKPTGPDNTDFTNYLQTTRQAIQNQWHPPLSDQARSVGVAYRLDCKGKLIGLKVYHSSGLKEMDAAALQAIRKAAPFPPLPATYQGNSVEVQFDFDFALTSHADKKGKRS